MTTVRDFKPLAAISATDADLEAFAARKGVPTLSSAAPAAQATPTVVSIAAPKMAQVVRRVTLDLPEYVVDQLHDRARGNRCTTRHIIMTALKTAGVTINDDDMISDGRRLR